MVRSDVPANPSEEESAAAARRGFTSVLDLRSAEEVRAQPHPLADLDGYQNLPLIDPAAERTRDPTAEPTVGDVYVASLSRNAGRIGEIFNALAETASGPVMICCTAGRDRTGMVVALLLASAGVDRDAVVADYSLLAPESNDVSAGDLPVGVPVRRGAQDIRTMLEHVDATWGESAAYLRWLGLDDGAVDSVRRLLVR